MLNHDRNIQERAREGGPIRVALIGAGALARVIALQLTTELPEVRLVAIAAEDLAAARNVCAAAGMAVPRVVESSFGLGAAIGAGECAVTRNWCLLCESDKIDAIIEAADVPAHGAEVIRAATQAGKHVVATSLSLAEAQQERPNPPADRIELVPVAVDGSNFFDIVRRDEDGLSIPGETGSLPRRPSAPV